MSHVRVTQPLATARRGLPAGLVELEIVRLAHRVRKLEPRDRGMEQTSQPNGVRGVGGRDHEQVRHVCRPRRAAASRRCSRASSSITTVASARRRRARRGQAALRPAGGRRRRPRAPSDSRAPSAESSQDLPVPALPLSNSTRPGRRSHASHSRDRLPGRGLGARREAASLQERRAPRRGDAVATRGAQRLHPLRPAAQAAVEGLAVPWSSLGSHRSRVIAQMVPVRDRATAARSRRRRAGATGPIRTASRRRGLLLADRRQSSPVSAPRTTRPACSAAIWSPS